MGVRGEVGVREGRRGDGVREERRGVEEGGERRLGEGKEKDIGL